MKLSCFKWPKSPLKSLQSGSYKYSKSLLITLCEEQTKTASSGPLNQWVENQISLYNNWCIKKVCLKTRGNIFVNFSHKSSFRCLIVHLKCKLCALWRLPFCYIGSWQSQSPFTFILFKIISRIFLKKYSFHGIHFGTVCYENTSFYIWATFTSRSNIYLS